MKSSDDLVSIGLPVRNGADSLDRVIRSVLAQEHENVELVICDNASTDATSQICERYRAIDDRVVYRRHPTNIGLLNNFISAIENSSGQYFRWIGDDDWLHPAYVSKSLEGFAEDERRIVVTTRMAYRRPDGDLIVDDSYNGAGLDSNSAMTRLRTVLNLLNRGPFAIDPIYSMVRRDLVAAIPRRNTLREDQIFAVKLALAGPWGHIGETLAERNTRVETRISVARVLDVPAWQARMANTFQCWETLKYVRHSESLAGHRAQAGAAVGRMYLRREIDLYKSGFKRAQRRLSPAPS